MGKSIILNHPRDSKHALWCPQMKNKSDIAILFTLYTFYNAAVLSLLKDSKMHVYGVGMNTDKRSQ